LGRTITAKKILLVTSRGGRKKVLKEGNDPVLRKAQRIHLAYSRKGEGHTLYSFRVERKKKTKEKDACRGNGGCQKFLEKGGPLLEALGGSTFKKVKENQGNPNLFRRMFKMFSSTQRRRNPSTEGS